MGCPVLEALGPPSLKVFKSRWDKTLSNLAWFGHEVGLEVS